MWARPLAALLVLTAAKGAVSACNGDAPIFNKCKDSCDCRTRNCVKMSKSKDGYCGDRLAPPPPPSSGASGQATAHARPALSAQHAPGARSLITCPSPPLSG